MVPLDIMKTSVSKKFKYHDTFNWLKINVYQINQRVVYKVNACIILQLNINNLLFFYLI